MCYFVALDQYLKSNKLLLDESKLRKNFSPPPPHIIVPGSTPNLRSKQSQYKMSSLADYLAKNYLTADSQPERPKKKRKKNKPTDNSGDTGLIIADDDPPSLRASAGDLMNDNEYDENSPYILDSTTSRSISAEFKKKKKSNWKVIGGESTGSKSEAKGQGQGQDEADAILASAVAESAARLEEIEADDAPTIEGGIHEAEDDGPRMESGARAGLQTAAQTAAMVAAQERRKKAELAAFQTSVKQQGQEGGGGGETIYRDASGRIINVAMKRAEARKAAEEAAKAEQAAKESLMGDVQRQQKQERIEQLRSARAMPLARTIEDEDLNEELRAKERWNDPAAQFLTSKKAGVSKTGRPLYKGGFTPNRYGIRPGHRWDGVDRSNGFEKEWFQARARKERIRDLEYEWQMDE
ncbi:cell cycle control protein (Cwf26), putative [Talaromyces stipitatus ATCC 10500]|uniref:Cell cycle control protein (Cwf26), putative n=1 Tax=Talaromyces stipitatus (strain ATCC 10500 / CBS 375.48 / QM 6759 / NRRL 1006) TaxID=441959 RepID=B8MP48_TALSN|nr:cell cycle control protein (Cwf26), putative [Talaromyces stipitatus ATCC 10500]EED14287.1 cell cycle control protein (Cwf26), putative [Talaromyces stipitatus ATCC 10500]